MTRKIYLLTAIILLTLTIMSCKNEIPTLPDELSNDAATEEPYYIQYNSDFTYSDGSDSTSTVRQGQRAETLCQIRPYNGVLYIDTPSYTFCKYNPVTGNVVTVCQRPGCFHDTYNCPFAGMLDTEFSIVNNSIYFTASEFGRNTNSKGYGYYVYDLDDDRIIKSKAERSENTIRLNGIFVDSDGNQYYYDPQYDEENCKYTYVLCKYSPEYEKTAVLHRFEEGGDEAIPMYVDEIDGRLYYLDGIGFGVYHEDTGEREEIYHGYAVDIANDGEYFYFMDNDNRMYRIPISDAAEAEVLTDFPVRYYYLTDNYIYYKLDEKVIVGKLPDGEDADLGSQKIYRMKKDGSDRELVWEFKDRFSLMSCDYFAVDGNYIYAFFVYWDEENQCFIESWSETYAVRIDVNTKEIYFINLKP